MTRLMHLGLSWLLLFCWPESVPALQEKEPIAVRSGTVTFQFYPLPDEKIDEVRLAGSMSAWDPFAPAFVMKRQSDGSLRLDLPLTAGTHRFKFVVDGRWTADMRDISGRYRPSFAVSDGGNLGETNKGLVEVRDEAGLNLQAKAALRNLVKDENGDRMKLYAEVAKALLQIVL